MAEWKFSTTVLLQTNIGGTSDHNCVEWKAISSNTNNIKSTTKCYVRRFPQSSLEAFGRWISSHSWFTDVQELPSASNLSTSLTTDLKNSIDVFFPLKQVKIHDTDKPWMTPSLKQLIIERQSAFHSGDEELWRHYRKKVKDEISQRKRTYYSNKVKQLRFSEPKKWWDYIKKISGKNNTTSAIHITRDGDELTGPALAHVLNNHFSNVSADLPSLDLSSLPAYLPATEPVPLITPQEVCKKLLKINPLKSQGPDSVSNRILKEFAYELALPVCTIFNTSLSTGLVPSIWKDAIITPVPKCSSVSCEDELRPIALTSALSKVLEDFVVTWMLEDVKHKIDPKQFGSLKGSSTSFCLIDMMNNWLRALDAPSHYLRVCFVDFSKAFDRINHNILVEKLLSLGVRACLIPWICDFLSNRRQCVKVHGSLSDWVFMKGGVPQGTKLGPVLFLVMINDLELQNQNMSHWKYVDDVTISENLIKGEPSNLQSAIDKIQQWADVNDMKINGKKCKEMTISFLRDKPNTSPLRIDGQQIDCVQSFKVLGIIITNQLKWSENTDAIVKKASKRLHILRVLRRSGIPPTDLLPIFFGLVRSILEYACTVWHTCLPQYQRLRLELVQKRALRIIYPEMHYEEALSEAKCQRLDERRQLLCNKTFTKINERGSRLNHLVPQTRANTHQRNLRNSKDVSLPKCRTERYKQSFIPAMCFGSRH